ncbi:hypothetical protein LguiA_029367 [Lonicera macranthoides]
MIHYILEDSLLVCKSRIILASYVREYWSDISNSRVFFSSLAIKNFDPILGMKLTPVLVPLA